MDIICKRCKYFSDCECVPYDIECDEHFEPKNNSEEPVNYEL